MEIFSRFPAILLRPRAQSPEQELLHTRRELDMAWRKLGGPSGKEATKEQIIQLLASELRAVHAEIHNLSLAEEPEKLQKLDTEESLRFVSNWFLKQKTIWQKRWLFKEGDYSERLEVQRRIIACKCAIELLTPSKAQSPIA